MTLIKKSEFVLVQKLVGSKLHTLYWGGFPRPVFKSGIVEPGTKLPNFCYPYQAPTGPKNKANMYPYDILLPQLIASFINLQQKWWHPDILCCSRDKWQDDLPNLLYLVGQVINHLISDQTTNIYGGMHQSVVDSMFSIT